MTRVAVTFCSLLGLLHLAGFLFGSLGVIDYNVCIATPGKCIESTK